MEMQVRLNRGTRVDAVYKGFTIRTDQPARAGGGDVAPAPFDYFLASIGTCAGFYVMRFLEQRELPVDGVSLTLRTEKDPVTRRISKITLDLGLPGTFPDKYEKAILRAIDQCSVKRHILEPPVFETVIRRPDLVKTA